jgi:hypothetical protein
MIYPTKKDIWLVLIVAIDGHLPGIQWQCGFEEITVSMLPVLYTVQT